MKYEDGEEPSPPAGVPSSPLPDAASTPASAPSGASAGAPLGADIPLLTRLIMLFYALAWFGMLMGVLVVATYANAAVAALLVPLMKMAPIITRAWFSPVRLRHALFFRQWKGLGLSALEGLAASALLPLYLLGVIALAKSQPDFADLLIGGAPTDDWPNYLAGMAAVAIGEEVFFRGFLQHELSLALQDKPRLGARMLGGGWILASVLFGVAHVITQQSVGLLTLFPGLAFGYLYARRQQIAGPAIFHFSCNILVAVATAAGWLEAPPPENPAAVPVPAVQTPATPH